MVVGCGNTSSTFQVELSDTVGHFKEMIEGRMGVPVERQKLLFGQELLVDEVAPLSTYFKDRNKNVLYFIVFLIDVLYDKHLEGIELSKLPDFFMIHYN
jgi:hypothetical protein